MTIYPATSADFTATTGLTAQWGRTFQEASGNLSAGWGSGDLTVGATPTFHVSVDGRYGVQYDGGGDNHRANINGLGTASGIYVGVFSGRSALQHIGVNYVGYSSAGNDKRVQSYMSGASGYTPGLYVASDANTLSVTGTANLSSGVYLVLVQIDRAAGIARMRISSVTALVEVISGSIAGFGTFTQAASDTWFGAGEPANGAGPNQAGSSAYGAVITGTQCEGSGVLASLAASLGWEGNARGTLSATLGAATVAGTGTAPIAGALTSTLGASTVAGTGTVATVGDITGALAATLDAATSTAVGVVPIAGTADATLGALTGAAAATVSVSGATAATLGESTLAGAGAVSVTGAGLVDLGAVAGPLAGVVPVIGAASGTLGAATLVAVANTPGGALDASLGALTSEAAGTVPATGQVDQTLGAITMTAGNVTEYTGSLAQTLGALTSVAAGALVFPRSGTTTIGAIRDRVATILEQLTPSTESGVRFRRHREETDFRDWADRNPAACFRRFSVRATGSRAQPEISNLDEEAEERDLELVIAYPTTSRFGGNAALNRDDVIDQDVIQICRNAGTESYGGYASATVLTESTSRDDGTPTTFATVALRAVFQRAMP